MFAESNNLAVLARRVSRQDDDSALQLRGAIAPSLGHMVRRVLRTRLTITWVDDLILDEINRLPDEGRGYSPEEEWLVGQIAERVCAAVIDELRAGPVRSMTASEAAYETVVA